MSKISNILGDSEIRAIEKTGDIMIPKNEEFPSFSELGCIEHIDYVLQYAPEAEINDLKMLLKTLNAMPDKVLRGTIKLLSNNEALPDMISNTIRLVDTGLRGIIFTLYYSGKVGKNYVGPTPLDIIGFSINRV